MVCSATLRSCLAVRIVDIDDAASERSGAGAFKQAALGCEIVLHRVVKIEMIARQIGEDGSRKAATPQTIERQGVRTAFQNRVVPPARTISERKRCRSRDSGVVVLAG